MNDPEVSALSTVLHALRVLAPEERERVLSYANRWHADSVKHEDEAAARTAATGQGRRRRAARKGSSRT